MSLDARHIAPALLESISLVFGAAVDPRRRGYVVDVARRVRQVAFDASDTFPTISLADFVAQIGSSDENVVMPSAALAEQTTIGGLIPYYYLGAIVRALRPKSCFEIGTYLGLSALTMALNTPEECRISTIDLPADAGSRDIATLTKGDASLAAAARDKVGIAFLNHPLSRKITQLRVNSATFDARGAIGQADFCFVDGGHSYELIKADTENCLGIISPGGVIMWDDYRWGLPGVATYLRERLPSMRLLRLEGTQYVIYRHPE